VKLNGTGLRIAVIGTVVCTIIAGYGALRIHAQTDTAGWVSLFNGTSLDGWDGRSDVWKVENGAITGQTLGGPTSVTDSTYIFWKGGEPADFELKAEIRTDGEHVNSGIVYRGYVVPPPAGRGGGGGRGASGASGRGRGPGNSPYLLAGPQLDIDGANRYSGQYYEIASPFGLLVHRGQVVETGGSQAETVARFGDDKTLSAFVKAGDWNQYRVIAHGNTLINIVNDHLMSIVVDRDSKVRTKGLLAFQIEGLGKVQIRNISLRMD
jgi:hypothetical protein